MTRSRSGVVVWVVVASRASWTALQAYIYHRLGPLRAFTHHTFLQILPGSTLRRFCNLLWTRFVVSAGLPATIFHLSTKFPFYYVGVLLVACCWRDSLSLYILTLVLIQLHTVSVAGCSPARTFLQWFDSRLRSGALLMHQDAGNSMTHSSYRCNHHRFGRAARRSPRAFFLHRTKTAVYLPVVGATFHYRCCYDVQHMNVVFALFRFCVCICHPVASSTRFSGFTIFCPYYSTTAS